MHTQHNTRKPSDIQKTERRYKCCVCSHADTTQITRRCIATRHVSCLTRTDDCEAMEAHAVPPPNSRLGKRGTKRAGLLGNLSKSDDHLGRLHRLQRAQKTTVALLDGSKAHAQPLIPLMCRPVGTTSGAPASTAARMTSRDRSELLA